MICQAAMAWERTAAADEDAALLKRRHPEALNALVTRYQHRLYRYLRRLVGDGAAADDLYQQTWLRVLDQAGRYDARRAFEPWLFAIAHNLAVDHLRRKRPGSLHEPAAPGAPAPVEILAAPDDGALERYLAGERAAALQAALDELPASYREVLTLRFEQDMKLEEIAQVAGAPLPTVKSRMRRALIELRSRLERGMREQQ